MYLQNLWLWRPNACLHLHQSVLWLLCFSTFFQTLLNEAGYVPSNTEKYPLGGIVSAIENAFHMSPLIICSKGSVEELRLCFYKDFKVGNLLCNFSAYKKLNDIVQIFVSKDRQHLDANCCGMRQLVQPVVAGNLNYWYLYWTSWSDL